MIKLEEITADNLEDVLKLKVSKNQENFVSTTAYSLAQAYVYQENAYPFAIYADDTLVGFIMFGFYESRNQYTLWKFLIDKCHQNKGYGKTALLLGIERMKEEHNIQKMYTGVSLGNEVAERLYKSVGFQLTGLVENGMKELRYVFAKSESVSDNNHRSKSSSKRLGGQNMKNVIIVCGLNGAGKSTLGKALAEKLNYQFIDIEDIYFPKDNPEYMYLNPRPFEEVERILSNTISENNNFVLASVKGNFNKDIVSHFKYAVYIEAPKETRIKRVYERSYNKFGDRMLEGGDLYEKEKAFFDFVKSKDENTVEIWLPSISCPIIRVDGTLPIDNNAELIAEKLSKQF